MMPPVIILAGGLGTRLRNVTHDNMPKPMVPVTYHGEEHPFMEFLLSWLYDQGVRNVIMCVDHLAEQVVSHFGDGHRHGMQITYDNAGPVLTAARVKHAMEKIDNSEVIIHCGDVFHPLNIDRFLLNFHQHPENLLQIAVHNKQQNEDTDPNLVINEKSQVVGYKMEKSDKNRLALDTGVLVVHREILSYISNSPEASLTEDLYPALIKQNVVGAYESKAVFYDIGTPSEYSRFCSYVEQSGIQSLLKHGNSTDEIV